jgi:hypothetical protein
MARNREHAGEENMNKFGLTGAAVCAAVLAWAPGVHAENWTDTGHDILIDVDSIHKDSDGLVYYLEKTHSYDMDEEGNPAGSHWEDAAKAAVDCGKRLAYSSYSITYEKDWRAKGQPAAPGTMGGELLEFVCSRLKDGGG